MSKMNFYVTIGLLFLYFSLNIFPSFCGKVCRGEDTDPCRCELKNGSGVIDVRKFGEQMNNGLPWTFETPSYLGDYGGLFSYNPCYPFTMTYFDGQSIGGLAMSHCMDPVNYTIRDVGQQNRSLFEETDNNGIQIKYTSKNGEHYSLVILSCLPNADYNFVSNINQTKEEVFIFEWVGNGICPVPTGRSKPRSVSTGIIVLAAVGTLTVIYLIVGLIYKYINSGRVAESNNGGDMVQDDVSESLTRSRNIKINKGDILDDSHQSVNHPRSYGSFDEHVEDSHMEKHLRCNSA